MWSVNGYMKGNRDNKVRSRQSRGENQERDGENNLKNEAIDKI